MHASDVIYLSVIFVQIFVFISSSDQMTLVKLQPY